MDVKELIGVTLGSCKLEQILGRGGMGAVYLAQQARPIRTVAVKVLIPASGYDADEQRIFLERFRREADTVAKLEHKNILPIYEYAEAVVDGQRLAYLVMPYIRGGTLRELIDEMKRQGRRFDLNTVASYISQVADALTYAHSLGVVHRDIKPGNLLFHQDGRLLLSDFGIVRLSAMPSLTTVGSFLGTAEYASPEQVSGGVVDARSDIYSLGIILFELLMGDVPFSGPNPFAVMSKHLNDPVPSIRAIRPDLSPAIEFVVKKSLARNPKDRYQTANEMAADLQAAISPALASSVGMRLTGDASNNELTMADRAWQPPSPLGMAAPIERTVAAIPPAVAAKPAQPSGGAPWQQPPRPWQWPSQAANGVGIQFNAPSLEQMPPGSTVAAEIHASIPTYRQGRRLFYFAVALVALLMQFLILILFYVPGKAGTASPGILGILLGAGVNLLALAGIGFTGVTRNRRIRRFIYRCLVVALIAPLISGFFISFGVPIHSNDINVPIIAYAVLLLSNIYTIRLLGSVDTAHEQLEVAPVLWRPAIVGALTGLLPLTIILIFTLILPAPLAATDPLLTHIFGVLFVAFIGAPTPGAMMAVWLSQKMTFPVLLRSSAIAGMLMFLGAFLLVVLLGIASSNHALFYYHFSQPALAALVGAVLLGLIGLLRGMLDAWIYSRVMRRGKA